VQVITDTEGRRKFVHFLGNLIRDENNKPVRIDGSCRDQTRLTIAQLELRKSEEKFRKMIESAGEAIIITEMLTGIITEVNNRAEILLETSRQKLLGNKLVEFLLPENADFLQHTFNATKNEDKVVTPIDLKTAKDNIIPVEINSTILTIGNHFYHQGIFIDMREKRKIELELQKAIEKEKAVNKMKMKFVSTASHQFRTPLSVIQSNIDLMELKFERRKDTGYKDLKPLFDGVYAEVDLMTDIMENVLILGKLDSGRIQFAPKPADLIALCEDILSTQFNVTADSRSIDFVYSGKKQDIAIDKKLIQHVIANLLNNALKYSPGKSNPRLSIEYLDNRVTIKVVDKGIGIPDEEMKNLFQSFYRASNTEDIPGTGLGLTIVKEFIELHGGLINVTSSLNEGTVFTITFFYGVNNEKDSTN
jgi:PAS domain S-box-containing protein